MAVSAITYRMPAEFTDETVLALRKQLEQLGDAAQYTFDFGASRHFGPLGMVLAAAVIRQFRSSKPDSRFTAIGFEVKGYAAHMGFFQAFGLDHGKKPGEASGSSTYIPVTVEPQAEFFKELGRFDGGMHDTLDARALELAQMLCRAKEGPSVETSQYSLREALRNCVEHSECENVSFCAQYWPTMHRVEIAVYDDGVGIAATLATNSSLYVPSDLVALRYALMPGVSKVPRTKKRSDNPWANSGYGLYMLSRLCGEGGRFLIASGASAIRIQDNKQRSAASTVRGTALQLVLDTDRLQDIPRKLAVWRDEGFEASKEFWDSESGARPSVASGTLSRFFGKST